MRWRRTSDTYPGLSTSIPHSHHISSSALRVLPKFWGFALSNSWLIQRATAQWGPPPPGCWERDIGLQVIGELRAQVETTRKLRIPVQHGRDPDRWWCIALATTSTEDYPLPRDPPPERCYRVLEETLGGVKPRWHRGHVLCAIVVALWSSMEYLHGVATLPIHRVPKRVLG